MYFWLQLALQPKTLAQWTDETSKILCPSIGTADCKLQQCICSASFSAPDANLKATHTTESFFQIKPWLMFKDDKLMPTFCSCKTHLLHLALRPPVKSPFGHVYAYPPTLMFLHVNIPEHCGIMNVLTLE